MSGSPMGAMPPTGPTPPSVPSPAPMDNAGAPPAPMGDMGSMNPDMGASMSPMGQPQGEENIDAKSNVQKLAGQLSQALNNYIGQSDGSDEVRQTAKSAAQMTAAQAGKVLNSKDVKAIANTLNKAGNDDAMAGMPMDDGQGMGDPNMGMQPTGGAPTPPPPPQGGMPMESKIASEKLIQEIADELLRQKRPTHHSRPELKITNKRLKRSNPFVCER